MSARKPRHGLSDVTKVKVIVAIVLPNGHCGKQKQMPPHGVDIAMCAQHGLGPAEADRRKREQQAEEPTNWQAVEKLRRCPTKKTPRPRGMRFCSWRSSTTPNRAALSTTSFDSSMLTTGRFASRRRVGQGDCAIVGNLA